ncbi:tetratricopeptide repeat protein [Thermodesulfobacteriota bacterium]
MNKKSKARFLGKMGIIFLLIILFSSYSVAGDWFELNLMSELELKEKIIEFEKRLDQNQHDYETFKALGVAYGIMARKDAKKFAPSSVDMLTKAHEMNKKDYVVLCSLGNSTTMMANTTWNPMKKMFYANRGIALMDKAVRRAPDNVKVRLTRANNSKRLPDFLKQSDVAIEDYEYLAKLIEKDPKALGHLKKDVEMNLGELYKNKEETSH